ncbi:MAG: hypothetical protein HQM13_10390 [SAR324 cluster bacterium]|nr:hypothetical protein [SAR324 cluster bacterium]
MSRILPQMNRYFFNRTVLFFLGCWVGATGCTQTTNWVESNESCLFESESPPLRRVVNYSDSELCDRRPIAKKKRQKRLRELLEEE